MDQITKDKIAVGLACFVGTVAISFLAGFHSGSKFEKSNLPVLSCPAASTEKVTCTWENPIEMIQRCEDVHGNYSELWDYNNNEYIATCMKPSEEIEEITFTPYADRK